MARASMTTRRFMDSTSKARWRKDQPNEYSEIPIPPYLDGNSVGPPNWPSPFPGEQRSPRWRRRASVGTSSGKAIQSSKNRNAFPGRTRYVATLPIQNEEVNQPGAANLLRGQPDAVRVPVS